VRFEQDGDAEALANIGLLTQLVARWDEFGSSRNFYPFQHYLKLLREGGVDPVTVPPEGAVQVMTIHQAKGLEFPVVVLASVMNGRLPVTGRRDRYEIPYALRASGEPEVTDTHFVDERKLFYVAVTRARDLLILGTADVVRKKGGGPSTFLHEMFGENLRAVADVTQARLDEITSPEAATLPERSRYAFSDLAYYLQCPMRYKFAVVYGFAAPWMDPIGFGANVHRALDVIHQRALGGEMVSEEQVEPIVDEVWLSGLNVKEEQDARVRAAAANQIRRYLREHGDALARAVRAEDRFDFDFEGRVLRGQFDLLRKMEDGKGVELVDFKTSNALDLAQQGIDLQLDLYAMGVEADLRLPVALETAHFLADGERRTLVWSTQRKGQARGRLLELIPAIEREDYHPTATYCRHCDEFRSICAYASGQGKGGKA
jgi:DNA helicase-2/ATP-dependent DNA helicase PcrA